MNGFWILFYCVRIAWQYNPRIELIINFFHLKCEIIHYMGFILKKTKLCYKKITREHRLVWDFTFIMHYKVSRAFYLGELEQIHFVNNRNKFWFFSSCCSDVLSSSWDPTWFTITSNYTMMLLKMLFIQLKSW